MTTRSIIERIFKGDIKLSETEEIKRVVAGLSTDAKTFYLEKLENLYLHKEYLYKSNFHGIYHSEKVMLYALIIGLENDLSSTDLNILCDAAAFHDIGRVGETEDETHGRTSAIRFENINFFRDNCFYKDQQNLRILQAITDFHSQDYGTYPYLLETNISLYDINSENEERYKRLAFMLKDADALDRKRFGDYDPASLKVERLTYPVSKTLANFAGELNALYNHLTLKRPDPTLLTSEVGCAFHSIGCDYYKINSVLENGILSRAALAEEHLQGVNNFNGGNGYYWISVVPAKLFSLGNTPEHNTASEIFINTGITFVCQNIRIYNPIDLASLAYAKENSLPCSISGHPDERYVFHKINPSDIRAIVLSRNTGDMPLTEARYLYNNFNTSIIKHKINMFLSSINYPKKMEEIPLFTELFKEYENAIYKHFQKPRLVRIDEQEQLAVKLELLLTPINNLLGLILNDYYREYLPKDNLTVIDVTKLMIAKTNPSYNAFQGEAEYVLTLGKKE